MEHITILSGHHWLDFARQRIAALRRTGVRYTSQRYEIAGATIDVRIAGDEEFIRIEEEGGGFYCTPRSAEKRTLTTVRELEVKEATDDAPGEAKVGKEIEEYGVIDWLSYNPNSGEIGEEYITYDPGFPSRYGGTARAGSSKYWVDGDKAELQISHPLGMARHRESGAIVFAYIPAPGSAAISVVDAESPTGHRELARAEFPPSPLYTESVFIGVSQPIHFSGDGEKCVGLLQATFNTPYPDNRDQYVSRTWILRGAIGYDGQTLSAQITYSRTDDGTSLAEGVDAIQTEGVDLQPDGEEMSVRGVYSYRAGENGAPLYVTASQSTSSLKFGSETVLSYTSTGQSYRTYWTPVNPNDLNTDYIFTQPGSSGSTYDYMILGLDARFGVVVYALSASVPVTFSSTWIVYSSTGQAGPVSSTSSGGGFEPVRIVCKKGNTENIKDISAANSQLAVGFLAGAKNLAGGINRTGACVATQDGENILVAVALDPERALDNLPGASAFFARTLTGLFTPDGFQELPIVATDTEVDGDTEVSLHPIGLT